MERAPSLPLSFLCHRSYRVGSSSIHKDHLEEKHHCNTYIVGSIIQEEALIADPAPVNITYMHRQFVSQVR